MRYPKDVPIGIKTSEGFFCGDIPGGCRIECSECEHQQDDTITFGLPSVCLTCGSEMIYQEYWEW